MLTHHDQEKIRHPVPVGEIDKTPEIYALFERDEMTAGAANLLIGVARCRTIGRAARLGRRHLLALPGIGRKTLDELERVASGYGVVVLP